jgi:hypothetical protein
MPGARGGESKILEYLQTPCSAEHLIYLYAFIYLLFFFFKEKLAVCFRFIEELEDRKFPWGAWYSLPLASYFGVWYICVFFFFFLCGTGV